MVKWFLEKDNVGGVNDPEKPNRKGILESVDGSLMTVESRFSRGEGLNAVGLSSE